MATPPPKAFDNAYLGFKGAVMITRADLSPLPPSRKKLIRALDTRGVFWMSLDVIQLCVKMKPLTSLTIILSTSVAWAVADDGLPKSEVRTLSKESKSP